MLGEARGKELVRHARRSIAAALGGPRATRLSEPWSREPAATFVTVRRGGQLQGCIGSLEPKRAIADDVATNAVSAALYDPRAQPLSLDAVDDLSIELSLLSPLEPIPVKDEESAIQALRPHVDGVVFQVGRRRATFLPQVWRDLPDPVDFLAQLKMKAGLPPHFWSDDVSLSRYTLEKWIDPAHEEIDA